MRKLPRERERIAPSSRGASTAGAQSPGAPIQTALFSQLGHKGDLILIHFRDSLEALNQLSSIWRRPSFTNFWICATPTSRLSNSALRIQPQELRSRRQSGAAFPEWKAEIAATLAGNPPPWARLYPAIPTQSTSPLSMDASAANRSTGNIPFSERQRMMHEHGLIGRATATCQANHLGSIAWTTGVGVDLSQTIPWSSRADLRDALR